MQGLSFVSFEQSKARKKAHAAGKDEAVVAATGVELGETVHRRGTIHGHVRTGTLEFVGPGPEVQQAQDTLKLPSSTRVKGIRPSPLDISPCDRAITIGCAFSPSTVSDYTKSPHSAVTGSRSPPTIVVTPAKNKFSPSDLTHDDPYHRPGYRPASSVYSRYTNCALRTVDQNAPPVPPLPLSINTSHACDHARRSVGTTFEEDRTPARSDSAGHSARHSKPLTPGLPTPRRSKGWWNIITSPFSARSAHRAFWRSPPLIEDSIPVLDDAEAMARTDPHAGVIFTVRAADDQALRTAPASGPQYKIYEDYRPFPTRADTAPGALDANMPSVNIYRIPSQGQAAAYYDPDRHFPSPCLESKFLSESPENDLRGWSPSHSVYLAEHHNDTLVQRPNGVDSRQAENDRTSEQLSRKGSSQAESTPAICFSTPSEDELKMVAFPKSQNDRSFVQTPGFSSRSPMSATPVVQDAHLARFVGPQSSFGEQKRVEVERTSVPAGPPLAGATMAHSEDYRGEWSVLLSEKTAIQVKHTRENSYGLGISDGDRELYPEPHQVSEKSVGHCYFEQRTIRTVDEQKPHRPWYRRFFWSLVAVACALLVLFVVILAVFIPRKRNDMAVNATWFNTTGFPDLSIGIMTVIQPTRTHMQSSCVAPSDLWTCAVPGLGETSVPDFRLEIRFREGQMAKNETPSDTNSRLVRKDLYSASPPVPSEDDQNFMGRTSDNASLPYNGEETPFYISLLDAAALQTVLTSQKRDSNYTYPYPSSKTTASNASTKAAEEIPSPNVRANGQPADEVMYPLVTSQPLRLFNRGGQTEHYGFYTYYDRTMLISGVPDPSTTNSTNITSNVALVNASAICTWSQTRLLVQIWTKKGVQNPLSVTNGTILAGNSTANDMSAPGSFPYPVTFKVDRHGGISDRKGVYCYGIDDSRLIRDGKLWVEEDRAAGGSALINPAQIPGSVPTSASKRDENSNENSRGGIDGGSGGCSCEWQNWT